MPINPLETPGEKRARLRREGAARSKKRRGKAEEAADPFCQDIKDKPKKDK